MDYDETKEMMKEFDIDNDNKITMDEFVNGMTKWLDKAKDTVNKRYHSIKLMKGLYEVINLYSRTFYCIK